MWHYAEHSNHSVEGNEWIAIITYKEFDAKLISGAEETFMGIRCDTRSMQNKLNVVLKIMNWYNKLGVLGLIYT